MSCKISVIYKVSAPFDIFTPMDFEKKKLKSFPIFGEEWCMKMGIIWVKICQTALSFAVMRCLAKHRRKKSTIKSERAILPALLRKM